MAAMYTPRQGVGAARVALAVAFAERNRLAAELDNDVGADPAEEKAAANEVARCRSTMQHALTVPEFNPNE